MPFDVLGYRAGSALVAQYHNYFAPLLAEINFERVPGCDRTIEGIPVACFMHDWSPSLGWLGEIVLIRGRRRGVCLCQHDLRGAIGLGTRSSEKRGGPLRTYFRWIIGRD